MFNWNLKLKKNRCFLWKEAAEVWKASVTREKVFHVLLSSINEDIKISNPFLSDTIFFFY